MMHLTTKTIPILLFVLAVCTMGAFAQDDGTALTVGAETLNSEGQGSSTADSRDAEGGEEEEATGKPLKVVWPILPVFWGAMVLWGAGMLVGAFFSKQPIVVRVCILLLAWFCQAFAAFCVFGFCASFEPGVGLDWKVGYAAAIFLLVATTTVLTAKLFQRAKNGNE